jgi:hypothetical protein
MFTSLGQADTRGSAVRRIVVLGQNFTLPERRVGCQMSESEWEGIIL